MAYLGNQVAPLVQALEGKELKLDSDGDSSIQASTDDTVVFKTNNTTAMTIDSTGRVLQPSVPAFRVGLTSGQSVTQTGSDINVVWNEGISSESDNCFSQGGFSWNSGVVTIPVSGVYAFSLLARADSVGSGYIIMKIIRNNDVGSNSEMYSIEGTPSSAYQAITGSGVFKCTASDTIKVTVYSDSDSDMSVTDDSIFSGHLIG